MPTFSSLADRIHELDNADNITVGNCQFQVLFTPGHAPGHVCFYNKLHGYLVGGDLLFEGGIGRTDFPGCNPDHMNNSLKTLFDQLPDDVVVLPGHGNRTTIGRERQTNVFITNLLHT